MAEHNSQPIQEFYQPQFSPDGDEKPPPYPPRPQQQPEYRPPLPPRRSRQSYGDDDPSIPIHYTRDPHKLTAYLIPFPKPTLKDTPPEKIPDRFLIYTPPPPPLSKPAEGEKEEKLHKVQRKWQEEVREAKTSTAKTASWKGIKSKATRGIDWAVQQTTSSNLDFINRLGGGPEKKDSDAHHDDGVHEEATTKKTVGLTDMIIVYPTSLTDSPDAIREEFVNSMLRTKSKAQRDAVLATGLLPVSFAIDLLATVIWPFGGLVEIDGVWAYSSIRGAKIARSTTKRLASSGDGKHEDEENKLRLSFAPSPRLDVLRRYLAARCHERDAKLFQSPGVSPTETEVLEAIGWAPSQTSGEKRNWEDEQWEVTEVKEDFRQVMGKGAREWDKWCKAFVKDPEKALKK
ncbi:putative secreted protein [Neofusicoccum parvum UCRNP2]|uniref:Putative secreted protein n=1 Tax=Botryosphaeria parva (strain UCR-NP2) TaxID=1287680 RepID=R1E7C1_BOTPV|nr:putative secreted protein [Neofusicoccum parvum UCRNP2]